MFDVRVVLVVADHFAGDIGTRTDRMDVGALAAGPDAGQRAQRTELAQRVVVAFCFGVDVGPVVVPVGVAHPAQARWRLGRAALVAPR